MPGKDEQNQFDKEYIRMKNENAERIRRQKYNPDGTLRNPPGPNEE